MNDVYKNHLKELDAENYNYSAMDVVSTLYVIL